MSSNPYQATVHTPLVAESGELCRQVSINPFDLYRRAFRFLGDQYWLFLGISVVAMLLGAAIPFGLIMGALLIGVFICFLQHERGQKVEFSTLFKGFDQFGDAIVAILIILGITILATIPVLIVTMVTVFGIMAVMPPGQLESGFGVLMIVALYLGFIAVSMLIYAPFLFVFPLMAERKMLPWPAVKLSFKGMKRNIYGVFGFVIVNGIISFLLVAMCYLPLFFFVPIIFAATHLLYRDIYST